MTEPANPAALLLSVDYELFGDGSGCVQSCLLDPAASILHTAGEFGVPVTLFVESLEFRVMRGQADLAATVAQVEEQLCGAVRAGHELALHLHPQWLDAKRTPAGKWQVEMSKWRLGDCAAEELEAPLREGRAWLDSLTRRGGSDRRCTTFRAGAWCMQPEADLLGLLARLGFEIDSTVAPGLHNAAAGDWYDFRGAPDLPCWRVDRSLLRPESQGLLELPIAVGSAPPLIQLQRLLARKLGREPEMAPGCSGSYRGPNNRWQTWRGKLGKLGNLGSTMLDLSTLDAESMLGIVNQWRARHGAPERKIPVVAISHNKNFTRASREQMYRFLEMASRDPSLDFTTFGSWLDARTTDA